MKRCTDKAGDWPDAFAHVSPHKLEEFLAHVDVCPYHAEILREEEDALRPVFRLARGLEGHGGILQGAELQSAIEEHKKRWKNWNEAALRKELPISHISLYNCGTLIARCGKFLEFTEHNASHELDPQAGLQIRGVLSGDADSESLLGFYPLVGVRHEGNEHRIPLENGYTVGLTVHKINERTFNIRLRCVESEVIEQELAKGLAEAGKNRKARAAGANGSFMSEPSSNVSTNHTSPIFNGWPPPPVWETVAQYAVAFLVIALVISPVFGLLQIKTVAARDSHHDENIDPIGKELLSSKQSTEGAASVEESKEEGVSSSSGKTDGLASTKQRGQASKAPSAPSIGGIYVGSTGRRAHLAIRGLLIGSRGQGTRETTNRSRYLPAATNGTNLRTLSGDNVARYSPSWHLRSFVDKTDANDGRIIVHVGTDDKLEDQLLVAMQQQDKLAERINTDDVDAPESGQLTVVWSVVRQEKSVEVRTVIYIDGKSTTASFGGEGDCIEHACEDALMKAVSGVYGVIDGSLKGQGWSEAKQRSTALSEPTVTESASGQGPLLDVNTTSTPEVKDPIINRVVDTAGLGKTECGDEQ